MKAFEGEAAASIIAGTPTRESKTLLCFKEEKELIEMLIIQLNTLGSPATFKIHVVKVEFTDFQIPVKFTHPNSAAL